MNTLISNIDSRLRLMTWFSGLFAVLVALIALQIWVVGNALPAIRNLLHFSVSVMPPINVFALLCLMLSGIHMLLLRRIQVDKGKGVIFQPAGKIIATLVICFALILFIQALGVTNLDADRISAVNLLALKNPYLMPMPLNLTLSFLLLAIGLLAIDNETAEGQIPAQYLGFIVFILAFFSLLSAIYEFLLRNQSLVYTLSTALTTISLMALALGVFCARPNKGILAILRSKGSAGMLARHLFPSAIIIPALLGGLIFLGFQAGYWDAILGLALLSVTQIIIFQMIFWRNSLLVHQLDSERTNAKEELRLANTKLAERIRLQTAEIEVKTRELTQELTAKREIQEALLLQAETTNRIKNEFLAVISHELRSPLNSILGWATMLKSGKLAPEMTAKAVDIIERNARSQNLLINDLLDISMIISDKIRLQISPLSPQTFVSQAIESLRPLVEEKGLTLKADFQEDLPQVNGDAERLQQVLGNLLANAIKFTPPGGRILVKLSADEKTVVISVTDTGIGIASDFLPYIFERFRQAENSHTRKHGGLGLGLSIARHLIELHGGVLGVKSLGEGKGTTVFIELPQQINNPQETQN